MTKVLALSLRYTLSYLLEMPRLTRRGTFLFDTSSERPTYKTDRGPKKLGRMKPLLAKNGRRGLKSP